MKDRPSLAQLRQRVFKHSGSNYPEIGNFLSRRVGRPSAVFGTWLAVRLGLSAHVVTLLALIANLAGAVAIGTGWREGFAVGVGLLWLAYWLDHVDGQVARWRGTASLDGVYLDYLMHHAATMGLGFSLGLGLARQTGILGWSLAGFFVAMGWTFLSLHNDCRYKAMFQRLKRGLGEIRVGVGGEFRPTVPASWPRRGRGLISWPLQKACEPHIVLIGLTVIAILAVISPTFWLGAWKGYVMMMAVIAPSLALARVGKAVVMGSIEAEYGRWFQEDGAKAQG